MSTDYKFQAEKFALTDDQLHLLRNGFNYEVIPLSTVTAIEVQDGKDLKNWWWVLSIGIALCGYAFWDILQIILMLRDDDTYSIYAQRLVIPIIPMALGIYSIRIALRNTRVMIVKTGTKSYYFSLRDIIKRNQFLAFAEYLKVVYPKFQNLSRL
jgi:hypothetical protein